MIEIGLQREITALMKYVLNEDFRLSGYKNLPTGLLRASRGQVSFFGKDEYQVLLNCDGIHSFVPEAMTEEKITFLQKLEEDGVIRPALPG